MQWLYRFLSELNVVKVSLLIGMCFSTFNICPTPVVGKVAFPGWDGKFLVSGVEEGNQ